MNEPVKDTPGSSNLTAEQQRFYVERFGERYVAVQEMPQRPSRAARRRARYGGRGPR